MALSEPELFIDTPAHPRQQLLPTHSIPSDCAQTQDGTDVTRQWWEGKYRQRHREKVRLVSCCFDFRLTKTLRQRLEGFLVVGTQVMSV